MKEQESCHKIYRWSSHPLSSQLLVRSYLHSNDCINYRGTWKRYDVIASSNNSQYQYPGRKYTGVKLKPGTGYDPIAIATTTTTTVFMFQFATDR